MSACDNKLRSNLVEAMKLDEQKLEAEMQGVTPHIFSDLHEKKMEKLIKRRNRKRKVRGVLHYAMAACLVLLLTGSILIISSKDLKASKLSVDIIEWLEEFFSAEKGNSGRKKNPDVIFEESQIGYLPKGFEKVEEVESVALVYFKYQNDNEESVRVTVGMDKTLLQFDNVEDAYEVHRNERGYEYTMTADDKTGDITIVWSDEEGIYYYVSGNAAMEELLKVMNGITY